jgi:5'-3' exonuclease
VNRLDITKTFNFQLIFISLLREYFEIEYAVLAQQMKMRLDIERIIDDFVFFCFFIGNDFLPSLSALDIAEGSLDSLIDLYKRHLPEMTDYITEAGTIYWDRAEPFINMLGEHELESFKMRIDSIKHAQMERIVSFEGDFNSVRSEVVDRKTVIKNKVRAAINEKKVRKIVQLKNK